MQSQSNPPVGSISVERPTAVRMADRLGLTASSLCAVHCALLPAVIALLPALGLGFLAEHGFERGFVIFASILAISTAIVGIRRHRRFRAMWFLVPGVALLLAGVFTQFGHAGNGSGDIAHAIVVSIGGTLVALAHLTNLKLAHGHVHDAVCGH